MRFLGNILWILCGGLLSWFAWICAGILWCITIIGIPVGVQCFKLASISLNPFGKEIEYDSKTTSFLLNILWLLISGWEMALTNLLIGCLLCITIIGVPFGMQFFKIAGLSLRPFGVQVVREHYV